VTYGGGQDPDKEFHEYNYIDTIDGLSSGVSTTAVSNGSGGYTDSVNLFNMTVLRFQ